MFEMHDQLDASKDLTDYGNYLPQAVTMPVKLPQADTLRSPISMALLRRCVGHICASST